MKNFSDFKKNKQAFGQLKADTSPHGKHSFERSDREERRRQNRKQHGKSSLPKEQRLTKELEVQVATAWEYGSENVNLKLLQPNADIEDRAPDSEYAKEWQMIKENQFEFVEFVKDQHSFSSYSYGLNKVIVKKVGSERLIELPKIMFVPLITKEDIALYIMKREIGLCQENSK